MRKFEGIRLDIGCGRNKISPHYTGLDKTPLDGVEIVHDVEVFPWPLGDETVIDAVASHLFEHIKPWLTIPFMDEVWRILRPGGKFAMAMPYGISFIFIQDPTHVNPCNEATFQYFDPRFPLYDIYKPKPWSIDFGFPVWQMYGNIEILMTKMREGEKIDCCPHGRHMGRENLIYQGGAVSTCKCCQNDFPHYLPYSPDYCPVCQGLSGFFRGAGTGAAAKTDLNKDLKTVETEARTSIKKKMEGK